MRDKDEAHLQVGQFCWRSSHERRQCRWKTWPQNSFLLLPAADISSRQMMQTPSERWSSSAVASGKRSRRAVTWRRCVEYNQVNQKQPLRSSSFRKMKGDFARLQG